MNVELVIARNSQEASLRAAERLAAAAQRGGDVAFSGGSTPRRAYELAASLERDWSRVDAWLADERLERLVGDLLDLARLRRRTFSVRSEPVDLGELVAAAYERHAPAACRFGVELQTLTSPDAVAVADPDRLLQALSNLVENALRSTPSCETVRILAGPGRVEVVDDGPGLAERDVPRAFERFYLYERSENGRRVGTGLGLAVVRELAGAMGGSAYVRSQLGVGSTFGIELPVPADVAARLPRDSGSRQSA